MLPAYICVQAERSNGEVTDETQTKPESIETIIARIMRELPQPSVGADDAGEDEDEK